MSLIARWRMNEDAASKTVADSVGTNHGTSVRNTNLMSVAGPIDGRGFALNGTGDYVAVGDDAIFTPALTPFMVSAWVNMTDATNFNIASKGILNTDGEWRLRFGPTDKLSLIIIDNDAADRYIGRSYNFAYTALQGTWTHIAATYDGGTLSSGIKLYINGVKVDATDQKAGTFVTMVASGHDVWIGRDDTEYSNGSIDDVRIYNEASVQQVREIYLQGIGSGLYGSGNSTGIFPATNDSIFTGDSVAGNSIY